MAQKWSNLTKVILFNSKTETKRDLSPVQDADSKTIVLAASSSLRGG